MSAKNKITKAKKDGWAPGSQLINKEEFQRRKSEVRLNLLGENSQPWRSVIKGKVYENDLK
jgi:hypothetical protein